jgi:xylulokinase
MIREVGNSQRTGYTAAKIFHMFRHETELFKRTSTFFLVHNYINWYLTGGVRIMEPGDTSGMALWHPGKGTWSRRVIRAIDESLYDKLPEIKPSDQSIGVISADLTDKFGFHPHCKIDAGSGDNMYGAIGTGNIEPGIITISLGTSGTAYTFLEKTYIDDSGEIAAFCDSTGHHLPLLCVSNLANGYNQILRQFNLDHAQFNDLIKKTRPGNEGRILIPWYEGERTPDVPLAAPLYFGFGLEDFTPEKLSRAVLEGHILNLYDGF